jgi:hypothetical protein
MARYKFMTLVPQASKSKLNKIVRQTSHMKRERIQFSPGISCPDKEFSSRMRNRTKGKEERKVRSHENEYSLGLYKSDRLNFQALRENHRDCFNYTSQNITKL